MTVVVVGVGWLISIGLYELGLWPLGAALRVGVWIFALFGFYWVIRHLLRSPTERLMDEVERMRQAEDREVDF